MEGVFLDRTVQYSIVASGHLQWAALIQALEQRRKWDLKRSVPVCPTLVEVYRRLVIKKINAKELERSAPDLASAPGQILVTGGNQAK